MIITNNFVLNDIYDTSKIVHNFGAEYKLFEE